MTPGPPALCDGSVVHRREETAEHQFTYPISHVWLDPDRPHELCRLHPAWSDRRPAPARFRRRDYGTDPTRSLGDQARADAAEAIGRPIDGEVRMLTQLRRWGWLFNPITVFLVWDVDGPDAPVAAVLEVTNTPWKERHRYPLGLRRDGSWLRADFGKELHVSPFLGMDLRHRIRCEAPGDRMDVTVVNDGPDADGFAARLALRRREMESREMAAVLLRHPMLTHRVSVSIHRQALALWRKRIPFRRHPRTVHR